MFGGHVRLKLVPVDGRDVDRVQEGPCLSLVPGVDSSLAQDWLRLPWVYRRALVIKCHFNVLCWVCQGLNPISDSGRRLGGTSLDEFVCLS